MFKEMFNSKIQCQNDILNEELDQINNAGLGKLITYSIFMSAQTHIWHLLSTNAQEHTALGEFYEKLTSEVDELAERFIAQGGKLINIDNTLYVQYNEYEVINVLNEYRKYTSSIIQSIKEDSEMASMLDGVTDIQELIDNTIYKFKLK